MRASAVVTDRFFGEENTICVAQEAYSKEEGQAVLVGGIIDSREWIGLIGLHAHHYAIAKQHFNPHAQADTHDHEKRMCSPISPVNARLLALFCNDLCCAGDHGAILASDVADDLWVPAQSFHLVRIAGSEKFNLTLVDNQPYLNLLQFSGFLV